MTVTLLTSQSAPTATDADALITGVFQGPDGPVLTLSTDEIDLMAALTALGATGKAEEITKIPAAGRLATPVVVAVGLGPEPGAADAGPAQRQAYLERLRRAAGAATRDLASGLGRAKRIALALPAGEPDEAEAVALGGLLGGYAFRKYRTATNAPGDLEQIVYTVHEDAARRARILADAMALVRDLVNTAPADMVPADLAAVAERTAAAHGLGVQVLDENELAKEGFGGILAVGMGSTHPPRLVRLEYSHPDAVRTVVFAGKGITFDSGGLSLKPPKAMETMKADMSGAAAVLAALQAIAELGPAVNVVGYLPLAENMPGGGAQRPSDVITIYGGKTVEVLNTDAEGRLVLADALARSGADGPSLLIDVATLTGAQTGGARHPHGRGDGQRRFAGRGDRGRGQAGGRGHVADAATRGSPQGTRFDRRGHRQRVRRPQRRHARRRAVPARVRAGWGPLGSPGHRRPRLQRRRPVRVRRQGRHRGGGQDAGADRGGRGGRQACG